MKILAIIPARSNSKGLKDKNIKDLFGLPLCAYTIRAAKDSRVFDEIHFSTDSQLYAEIARQHGASIPFLRTSELASDTASSWDVVKFVVNKYLELGKTFDAIMLLQPTVPLRNSSDIVNATKLLTEKSANAIVSVTDPEHSPVLNAPLPEDCDMSIYHERFSNMVARQMLLRQYAINGAIYLAKTQYLMHSADIYQEKCYAYYMPRERSIDIDTQLDFDLCKFYMEYIKK